MNYLILLFLSVPLFADVSLDEAYRREKTYLQSQKDSLVKLKSGLVANFKSRKARAQKEIDTKQKELSAILLKNQEIQEEFKAIDKMTKESVQITGQLEKNSLKISEMFGAIKVKMGLVHAPSKELDPVKQFESVLNDGYALMNVISGENWHPQAFLDENDQLVQGEILFNGLFSAWGRVNEKVYSLVPYNNEFLKVSNAFTGQEIYLFSPNFERTAFKAARTWKESIADSLPGLVMMMIMICVLGLFILLARA